ncbi:MAG: lytic transglycosylase domain-containing protein [Longimicrobiales bacterium]|nr:lytic transglycosylase domain-containing protein [Longimicrobiales bacterium]
MVACTALTGRFVIEVLEVESTSQGPTLASLDGVTVESLPLKVNARVRYWIGRFTTDQRPTMETFLAHEEVFGPIIREKLEQRGMPEELIYLAGIESGFKPRATSVVSAAGVWQFMGPTALEYGLRVDDYVDERRDPIRATDAALDYLQYLHERYGSWYLAAAAYNAGPSRIDRALRSVANARRGDEAVFWEIQEHLPRETREYVPKMIAATMIAREAEAWGFGDVVRKLPYAFDRVWVPGGTTLRAVAEATDSEMAVMRALNPHLRQSVTPPGAPYALRVPVGASREVIASIGGGPWGTWVADD